MIGPEGAESCARRYGFSGSSVVVVDVKTRTAARDGKIGVLFKHIRYGT
jgi:hypothetical protein